MLRLIAVLYAATCITAHAQDRFVNDYNAMLYASVPFAANGNTSREDRLKFGFSANLSSVPVHRNFGVNVMDSRATHRSYVDIQWNPGTMDFSRFSIGGIEVLGFETIHHADGSQTEKSFWRFTPLKLGLLLGALAGIGYGISEALDDDDIDCRNGTIQDIPGLGKTCVVITGGK